MVTSAAVPLGEEPLRIAMVAPPWYEVPPHGYGGVEALCGALVEMLLLRGHDVTLIGAGEPGTAARFLRTYQEPQYERLGQVMPELVHAAAVNRLLASGDFDVIHDHTASGPLTAAVRRAPTVVTVHGPVDGELGDFYQSLGDAIHLVAISDAQRRCRPSLAWAATVHNSVRVEQFPYQARKGSYVLWLARFCQEKGPELAVKACREAGLPLVLVGKCSEPAERSYLADVVRPLVSPDVEIVLNADRERILELLAGARCLLLPLRWAEPFGMVMIEAMACGTPVVALDSGSVPEIVQPGVTGLICADTAELPEALHAVTTISAGACREHVRRSFSAELMAERYEQVYRATVANARRVSPALERPPILIRPGA
jgi:glycosyltransferase involved in cell wall biosynthesis